MLPQGASLDQALASAGGQKLLRARWNYTFQPRWLDRQAKILVSGGNPAGSYKNPILMAGDVVRVNDLPLSATVTLLNEITAPAVGVYSAYSLFQKF